MATGEDDRVPMAASRTGRLLAADIARIAVFAAFIAALGLAGKLNLFGNAVPITAQTLGVMLAGALIGARNGALACVVFALLVMAGLPLLSGGRGGLTWYTTAPNAGYLIGWPVGALVIGLLTARMLPRYRFWLGIVVNIVGGILVIYALGIPYQAWRQHSGLLAVTQGALEFFPGDLIKAVVAAAVAAQVHRAYPGLMGRTGRA